MGGEDYPGSQTNLEHLETFSELVILPHIHSDVPKTPSQFFHCTEDRPRKNEGECYGREACHGGDALLQVRCTFPVHKHKTGRRGLPVGRS